MLASLPDASIRRLTLGVRAHATLLNQDAALCRKVFERDRHTCHVCGTRIVDGMEIDHAAGHVRCTARDLRTICQFCHDLKHPLWSAMHHRIVPVYAPDIPQIALTRLSWSLIEWREQEAMKDHCEAVRQSLVARAESFSRIMKCKSAEALFEAALSLCDAADRKVVMEGLKRADLFTRFVPAEALIAPQSIGDTTIDQASRLSTWTIGGFKKITRTVSKSLRADMATEAAAEPAEAVSAEDGLAGLPGAV